MVFTEFGEDVSDLSFFFFPGVEGKKGGGEKAGAFSIHYLSLKMEEPLAGMNNQLRDQNNLRSNVK